MIAIQGSILLFLALVGCETGRPKFADAPRIGMFRVSVLYPNGEGKTFDFEYYEKKHMPMVASFLGENLTLYEVEKGVLGRTSGEKPSFLAIGYFYIDDINEYNKAIAQNRDTIINDFNNYTNIQPIIQISQIRKVVHNDAKRTKNEN
ncbi:EthD family reductase [Parapedobacter deserti]|uniref:EthD family reductase n=1 Tax=Parapedobacter deserti TaxID=1912957 RepID=A0ABV7JMT4_9SPHI